MDDTDTLLKKAGDILRARTPEFGRQELDAFVKGFLDRRATFLRAAQVHGSPLYVIEENVFLERVKTFVSAFGTELPRTRVFYAVKSNNHPLMVKAAVNGGLGLDVSSGEELQLALDSGASQILFSGPAKTVPELELAVENHDRVTVLMDSFGELARLEQVADRAGVTVRAGVRLTTDERGFWRKFGIPLTELASFMEQARACRHIRLCGLQFHVSWNLTPAHHVGFINRLGGALHDLPERLRTMIEFIDIGGGYWPAQGEWLQTSGTPEGKLSQTIAPFPEPPLSHYRFPAADIETFAREIGSAIRKEILPLIQCEIYTEPGRWLCNDAMHVLITVIDKKADDLVITDAGTNAIGWERFETDYFPVVNLSKPELTERPCLVLGSLCTPHDVWGYAYYGSDIVPGDVLLIPTQGAYTYSLRQHFIKPLPRSVILENQS